MEILAIILGALLLAYGASVIDTTPKGPQFTYTAPESHDRPTDTPTH